MIKRFLEFSYENETANRIVGIIEIALGITILFNSDKIANYIIGFL